MRERRRLFIEKTLLGHAPKEAALLAGYPEKGAAAAARRLLNRADVKLALAGAEEPRESETGFEGVTVDWVVREARRTYDAAHEAGSLSTAVSCLNLIGKHLEAKCQPDAPEAREPGVVVVTGIEKAPNSDDDA